MGSSETEAGDRAEAEVGDREAADVRDGSGAATAVEESRRAVEEEKQRYLRLLADFDNHRRRVAREHEVARREGQRAALLPLLPVLDTLERALAAGSTDPSFYEGVAATQRLFLDRLREAGAEPIATVGQRFDPRFHEVIATAASDEVEPGIIVRELRRGWRLGDDLLRPAQVEIAT
jgi:molecular chaperone GrpE